MAKDGRSVGARRGDRRRNGIAEEGNRGERWRREVGLAAENQLAIALSRKSAMRWFERVRRNGERPTENDEFRHRLRESGEGWRELKGPRG